MQDTERKALADSASTWMQVVFGGVSVTVAIVALVIGYFAWVKPQSADGQAGQIEKLPPAVTTTDATAEATVPPSRPDPDSQRVALADLVPSVGGANVQQSGGDLIMPCATGEATDRQRTVEYDLAGRYVTLSAKLNVSEAPDPDTKLQMKIFTDDRQAADEILAKGKSTTVDVPLDGKQKLQIQLTCQSRDSSMTIGSPTLGHV